MKTVSKCDYKPIIIYAIEHRGKIIYVGQTSRGVKARIGQHFAHATSSVGRLGRTCPLLYEFIRQNPERDNYRILILEQTTRADAHARERHFIAMHDTQKNGVNVTAGGVIAGEEHYLHGKHVAHHIVDASVAARVGKKLTPEHVEKIRKGNAKADRKDCRPVVRDDGVEYYGVAEAARQNDVNHNAIVQSLKKGYRASGHVFRYADGEFVTREEKPRGKAIRCLETGTIYSNAKEAAEVLGLSRGNLSQHLKGINKTCKGHTFELVTGSE